MRVASIEDDESQANIIRQILANIGYSCELYGSGSAFINACQHASFDLLIFDWELPDMTGLDLVKWVRTHLGDLPPILFVTNRKLEYDLVQAIEAGADDYMTKPLRGSEMVARIHAILRRTLPEGLKDSDVIARGPYRLDRHAKTVHLHDTAISISPREFDLAFFLFRNPDRLLTREAMERAVWGRPIGRDSRTLDTHLSHIRVKLALRPENGVRLVSIYGKGIRFESVQSD